MKIFVRHNEEESGPFNRNEIFSRLLTGECSQMDQARTEESAEWKPLMEVLSQSSSKALFSLDQITSQNEELPPPKVAFDPPIRRLQPEIEARPGVSVRALASLAAAGMLLAFLISYFLMREDHRETLATSASHGSGSPQGETVSAAATPGMVAVSSEPLRVQKIGTSDQAPPKQDSPTYAPPLVPKPSVPPAQPHSLVDASTPPVPEVSKMASIPASFPPSPAVIATPAPTKDIPSAPVVARQVKLPLADGIKESALWIAETALQPRAVLMLCLGPDDKVEAFVKDKEWQKFARDHQISLAAISFASDKKVLEAGNGYDRASKGSGSLLLAGLEQAFGGSLPLILYGRSGGGVFATSLAHWKPERVLFWTAYANQWNEPPKNDKSSKLALIVCDRESAAKSDEARKFFEQGRLQDKPWTWLCLTTPWKERARQVDEFFRDYARAVLLEGIDGKSVAWTDIDSRKTMSALDRMTRLTDASWLPNSALTEKWAALMPPTKRKGQATIVQRSVQTRNPKQPTIELFLRLPRSDGKKPASGMLAFCTWENNQAGILSKLDIQADDKPVDLPGPAALVRSVIRYAEDHNMAVLTWGTVDAWNNSVNTGEMEKEKQKEFDRNFDLLANAWERGVKDLSRETGVPTDNMLLYGISRGAQWAHRLALRKPEHFLAIHVHIPSTFDKPTPEGNQPLWLLTTGELEYGYERAKLFYGECQALNYPIIFKAIMGLGHQGSVLADSLGTKFFDYALSVKAQREEYERQRKDAMAHLVKQGSGPWLRAFREPEFLGDMVNQECFPVAQADMIPKPFRVPLPNKVLADAWNR